MPRVADYSRHWSRAKILRFLRAWDEEVDADDVADRFDLPNGRAATWLARTLRERIGVKSQRFQNRRDGLWLPTPEQPAAPATIYDAAGRAIAVMDPATRRRTPIAS